MSKIEGYWEDFDEEFNGYVQEVKMNLKEMQMVCNKLSTYLSNAVMAEYKEQSDH